MYQLSTDQPLINQTWASINNKDNFKIINNQLNSRMLTLKDITNNQIQMQCIIINSRITNIIDIYIYSIDRGTAFSNMNFLEYKLNCWLYLIRIVFAELLQLSFKFFFVDLTNRVEELFLLVFIIFVNGYQEILEVIFEI
jgi:hypothetical protein